MTTAALRLRDDPDFRRYWLARALSITGSMVTAIALPVRVYRLSGSTVLTALVTALEAAPYLTGVDPAAWLQVLELLGVDATVRFGPADAEYAVRLDLTTTEDLDDVRRRLSGHQVTQTDEGLEIMDPDGETVVVHG